MLDLENAEETEIKLKTSVGSQKNQGNTRKTSTPALLITPKPLTVWIITNCEKNFKDMGIPGPPYLLPEKSVCRSRSNS